MDDNIDTNIDNSNNLNSRLLHILNDHIIDNNIIRLNSDNTRYVFGQKPSCIDHIYTNVPNKMTNMNTHNDMISDHKKLSVTYKLKE